MRPLAIRQGGAALLVIMLALGLLAAYFALNALNRSAQNERMRLNAAALGQAKETLIGFAATFRDTHALQAFGYMPCPDMNENPLPGGQASVAPTCPNTAISAVGRLPWRTLGLPALRDNNGECFWYAVSGNVKDVNPVTPINWDTLGQFIVQDAGGTVLAGATPHSRALAVILAPGAALGAQLRPTGAPAPECGGTINTNNYASYLEGVGLPWPPAAATTTTIAVANSASLTAGSNNDVAMWVSSRDIFDRVIRRSDFRFDIDTLINNIATCISSQPSISISYAQFKGLGRRSAPIPPNNLLDDFTTNCPPTGNQVGVLAHWQNNLLYTRPAGASVVTLNNGVTYSNCNAVLLFGGARTATQTRSNAGEIGDDTNNGTPGMYLEDDYPVAGLTKNATTFPNAGNYGGAAGFNSASPSADIARCIKPFAGQQVSSGGGFGAFNPQGVGVSVPGSLPPGVAPGTPTASIGNAAGASGGCLWYPTAIQLAGKVLRVFYNDWFSFADPVGGTDRGNGFTFQMVRGDIGVPTNCGTQTNMGVLDLTDGRGVISHIVETDVHQDAGNADSVENHTAIMRDGNLTHPPTLPIPPNPTATNGYLTIACDGTSSGCRHSPADKFEESPTPGVHNQRIEVHTGCDAACANCNIGAPLPANYSRVSVWVDCVKCNDVKGDLDRGAQKPTVSRCISPNPAMNTIYFGFTGGFRSGGAQQGVTLWNLDLRTE